MKMKINRATVISAVVVCMVKYCTAEVVADSQSNSNTIARTLDPGRVLSSLASSFMSRGYVPTGIGGGSQLVTFNVQNLFYLVLLKVLIYAAATIGGGHHFKDGYARSAPEEESPRFISDEEVLMFLSFLSGSPSCLKNVACQQPYQAKKYVAAGDILLKAAKMFSYNPDINYDYVLKEMDRAANVGLTGGGCGQFDCGSKQN